MKKLSRKGKVHPLTYDDYLAFLPPTILALTVVLSPEDKQVLAYLISCSIVSASASAPAPASLCGGNKIKSGVVDHPTSFNCNCFRCYMSYWVKWDASPNRQVIHEIIDAFEQGSSSSSSLNKIKKQRRKKSKGSSNYELSNNELMNRPVEKSLSRESEVFEQGVSAEEESTSNGSGCGEEVDGGGEMLQVEEKSSLRSVLSFLGGKFWTALLI